MPLGLEIKGSSLSLASFALRLDGPRNTSDGFSRLPWLSSLLVGWT